MGKYTLYQLLAYFFAYAFLGWVAEVGFHAVTKGEFINRGFLNGPVCPIYGVGVVAVLLILGDLINKAWVVFLVGLILPTAIELVTGWILDKIFHNKWWDYSNCKFNLHGYICLSFSILWAIAVVFVICVVHPAVERLVNLVLDPWATVAVSVMLAVFAVDCVVTVLQLLKLNKKLKELDEVTKIMRFGSDKIGKGVAQVTLKAEEKALKLKDKASAHHEKVVDGIVAKMPARLLNAFPTLKSRRNPEAVLAARESIERNKNRRKRAKSADASAAAVAQPSEEFADLPQAESKADD